MVVAIKEESFTKGLESAPKFVEMSTDPDKELVEW